MVIVVLGPPRSGTSLMAGILHSNGICMGEGFHCGDGRPASANPKGYFEDNRLTHLNIDVLRAAGGSN